ncbi:hypothetical protein ABZ721_10400 [Streptomyces sp. NPDC006733]|uniref:hypothetical protein n=1 Tax=Streptomyces sp. NPDC006733 TaxID=3155460 RepID=UPI0033C836AF
MARRTLAGLALAAGLVGAGLVAAPAHATVNPPCPVDSDCGGGDSGGTGGGGGGTPATYVLQGVIQNEGYETSGQGRRVKIRGYSRLADANNNRVDADYINVRCSAYDALGGYTTDYDSENGGALVDVHFASNFVYGYSSYRTIRVNCTHQATKNGVAYATTSTSIIDIPE